MRRHDLRRAAAPTGWSCTLVEAREEPRRGRGPRAPSVEDRLTAGTERCLSRPARRHQWLAGVAVAAVGMLTLTTGHGTMAGWSDQLVVSGNVVSAGTWGEDDEEVAEPLAPDLEEVTTAEEADAPAAEGPPVAEPEEPPTDPPVEEVAVASADDGTDDADEADPPEAPTHDSTEGEEVAAHSPEPVRPDPGGEEPTPPTGEPADPTEQPTQAAPLVDLAPGDQPLAVTRPEPAASPSETPPAPSTARPDVVDVVTQPAVQVVPLPDPVAVLLPDGHPLGLLTVRAGDRDGTALVRLTNLAAVPTTHDGVVAVHLWSDDGWELVALPPTPPRPAELAAGASTEVVVDLTDLPAGHYRVTRTLTLTGADGVPTTLDLTAELQLVAAAAGGPP